MRLVLVLLAACSASGPKDPHALVSCGSSWSATLGMTPAMCEAACANRPPSVGVSCLVTDDLGPGQLCFPSFTVDGVHGCCEPQDLSCTNGSGDQVFCRVDFLECP